MTHEDLRKRAVKWLTGTCHCGVVLSELVCYNEGCEIPDAIGWKHNQSILVEAKISRADFLANEQKHHTRSGLGMGRERYFLCPANLIKPEDLYDGYGLLWASNSTISVRVNAGRRSDFDRDGEMAMLVSALRRVRTREFLTIVRPDEEVAFASEEPAA